MSDVVDPVVSALAKGDSIGSYVVDKKLGEGGMGAVFLARDPVTKYAVAIKILFGAAAFSADLIARFRREASAPNEIGHPAFVRSIQFGSYEQRPYIVMEFLAGQSLGDLLKQGGVIPNARACNILMQIGDALQAAHEHGVIHRDMKPDNVFLLSGDVVKILDLGIAKFVGDAGGADKTKSNVLIGTPQTMSPEQCRSSTNIDHRSDIYSVGVVAYRMVAGRWPFDADNWGEIISGHLVHEPPPLRQIAPWVPEEFADIVHKALAKDPDHRFQHMREMRDALRPIADVTVPIPAEIPTMQAVYTKPLTTQSGSSGEVRPPTRPLTQAAPPARWGTFGAAVTAVGLLAGGGVYLFVRTPSTPSAAISPQPAPTPVPATPLPATPVAATTPKPREGRAHLTTVPDGATVYLDGKLLGTAPVDITGTADQARKVRVSAQGFNDREEEILLTEQGAKVELALTKAPPQPTKHSSTPAPASAKTKGEKKSTDRPADPFND